MSVYKKLMEARIQLQATPLKKSGLNKFAGYSYFELGDFLPTIQDIFHKVGLCGVVSYEVDLARLCITDTEDGTALTITSPMAEANLKGTHPIQNLGAVETYQRRYLWMTAMEIVENDVLDATTGSVEPVKAKPAPVAKPAEPAIKPPAKIAGKEGEWQLKVSTDPGADKKAWVDIVKEAVSLMLEAASSKDDVLNIFKNNRNIFDQLKLVSEDDHKDIMDCFTTAKKSFEGTK